MKALTQEQVEEILSKLRLHLYAVDQFPVQTVDELPDSPGIMVETVAVFDKHLTIEIYLP